MDVSDRSGEGGQLCGDGLGARNLKTEPPAVKVFAWMFLIDLVKVVTVRMVLVP